VAAQYDAAGNGDDRAKPPAWTDGKFAGAVANRRFVRSYCFEQKLSQNLPVSC